MSRKVEVYVSGCVLCDDAVALVRELACSSCDVEVRSMDDAATADAAKALGIHRVPAVVVDGTLLDCCQGGIDQSTLAAAGIGASIT